MTSNPEILLVDDSIEAVQILSRILEDVAEVRFALSGEDALAQVRSTVPALILLDIEMGDSTGFALLQQLREIPAAEDVPVAFVSIHDDTLMEIAALRAGAVGLLSKLSPPQVIKARVRQYLDSRTTDIASDPGLKTSGHQRRVLLVDEADVLNMAHLAAVLQELKAEVVLTSVPRDIESVHTEHGFDLIILGVDDPQQAQWAASCRHLLQPRDGRRGCPVALACDVIDAEFEERAIRAGCLDLVARKLPPRLLKARLSGLLQAAGSRDRDSVASP
jgi:PleD family two-component response regulator